MALPSDVNVISELAKIKEIINKMKAEAEKKARAHSSADGSAPASGSESKVTTIVSTATPATDDPNSVITVTTTTTITSLAPVDAFATVVMKFANAMEDSVNQALTKAETVMKVKFKECCVFFCEEIESFPSIDEFLRSVSNLVVVFREAAAKNKAVEDKLARERIRALQRQAHEERVAAVKNKNKAAASSLLGSMKAKSLLTKSMNGSGSGSGNFVDQGKTVDQGNAVQSVAAGAPNENASLQQPGQTETNDFPSLLHAAVSTSFGSISKLRA